MKQFTRCTSCQQWYVRTYTAPVELYHGDNRRCLTVWCLRCVDAAEQRSQPLSASDVPVVARPAADPVTPEEPGGQGPSSETFQQCMQEHLQLMDRALYEEDAILVTAVHDFIARCRLYQTHLEDPAQRQRLTGHLRYWETFLRALNS